MAQFRHSLDALWQDVQNSVRDLLPIVFVIGGFQLFVIRQPVEGLDEIVAGAVLVLLGLAFFVFGLRLALFPLGERLAYSLASKAKITSLLGFAFALGFGTTIAEPALTAIAAEAAEVAAAAGAISADAEARGRYSLGLRLTVATAVGVALIIGVVRMLVDWSLPLLIISGYGLVIALTTIAPPEIVGVAYDSGGVTTSTVTVPLVTALGIGLASSLKGRNPMLDGFGLIAFASLLPIIFVLIYGTVI